MMRPVFILLILTIVNFPVKAVEKEPENTVVEVHKKALTVDTHCDTPMLMIEDNFDVGE